MNCPTYLTCRYTAPPIHGPADIFVPAGKMLLNTGMRSGEG